MTLAVFGNTFRPTVLKIMEIIFFFFNEKEDTLLLDKELFNYYQEHTNVQSNQQQLIMDDNFSADFALSIGGDGTFLNTAARIGWVSTPVDWVSWRTCRLMK